ncbi:MAG: Trk system potassium transporter TrkA [Sutterella sp.]|nr:Trk system potassium transporter TrkA [Sutterella sp.]
MKILIVGAGRIGTSVAESLVSEANDITVVDLDAEHINSLQQRFDLRGLVGNATSPQVLTDAGAADTDMLIAVTSSDETNLVVCMLCARIFNIPTRIARVRNNELRDFPRILGEEGFEATSVIWPEQALVSYLIKLIDFPEALQVQEFGEGLASLLAVRAKGGSPLVGRPIRDLFTHLPQVPARIVAVFRRNRRLEINAATIIEAGDEVICLCDSRDARHVMSEFRHREKPIRNIVLAGKPSMALSLTRLLLSGEKQQSKQNYNIRILEKDKSEVKKLSKALGDGAIVIEGDFTDEDVLEATGIETCDLFIALSEDDENNILGSLLAKKLGALKTIALVNRKAYGDLMQGSQIDITLSTTNAALGELIRHVRRGDVAAAYSLRRGAAEALEIVAHGDRRSSRVVGRRIGSISLPEGCAIGALIRGTDDNALVLMGDKETVIEAEDHVIVFVPSKKLIPKIERLFTVNVGFF